MRKTSIIHIFTYTPPLVFTIFLAIGLTACSNNANTTSTSASSASKTVQEVQLGTVVDVKFIAVKDDSFQQTGNIGVTIGSGGHSGVYGSMDVSRMFDVFGNKPTPKSAQKQTITVKRNNGNVVAITQAITEHFNRGDKVKIVKRDGQALVVH